ncbi:MAG: hypothetical protein H7Z75_10910 [Ferruginibacter sp.]|nr:hypothetical protein [Cytophagales bacterium]
MNYITNMATKKAQTRLASTIEALNGGVDRAEPKGGATLIKDWIAPVEKHEPISGIANELRELRDQLGEKEPDTKKMGQLVKKPGDESRRRTPGFAERLGRVAE